MQPNKFLFFLIVGLAIAIVAGMFVAAYFFLSEPIELPTIQDKITIRVVVAPSIQPWAVQAARYRSSAASMSGCLSCPTMPMEPVRS